MEAAAVLIIALLLFAAAAVALGHVFHKEDEPEEIRIEVAYCNTCGELITRSRKHPTLWVNVYPQPLSWQSYEHLPREGSVREMSI